MLRVERLREVRSVEMDGWEGNCMSFMGMDMLMDVRW